MRFLYFLQAFNVISFLMKKVSIGNFLIVVLFLNRFVRKWFCNARRESYMFWWTSYPNNGPESAEIQTENIVVLQCSFSMKRFNKYSLLKALTVLKLYCSTGRELWFLLDLIECLLGWERQSTTGKSWLPSFPAASPRYMEHYAFIVSRVLETICCRNIAWGSSYFQRTFCSFLPSSFTE